MPRKNRQLEEQCKKRIYPKIQNVISKNVDEFIDNLEKDLYIGDSLLPYYNERIKYISSTLKKDLWNTLKKHNNQLEHLDKYFGNGSFHIQDTTGITTPSSEKEREWVLKIENDLGRKICKQYSIPEHPQYHVDGYDPETKTCYEYLGDYWHGNPLIYEKEQYCVQRQCTFGEIYDFTMNRIEKIKSYGYKVVIKWENQNTY